MVSRFFITSKVGKNKVSLLCDKGVVALLAAVVVVMGANASPVSISDSMPDVIPERIVADWEAQDSTDYDKSIAAIKLKYPHIADKITGKGREGYLHACHLRRVARLSPYAEDLQKMIVAKHHDVGGVIVGYTEDLRGDGVKGVGDWNVPAVSRSDDYGMGGNSALYVIAFTNYYPAKDVLLADSIGTLRDPCPSPDGKTLVYAHAKDNNGYHLYSMNLDTRACRQLTDNIGNVNVSDFEPCVVPPFDDIIFNSSRCFGAVACNINITSNLYIMSKDGLYLRRIGYDQGHTFNPTCRWEDGRVMYSRWEHNDRNCNNSMGIFTMNPDGSHQAAWFGNQTATPEMFNQARIIPGTNGKKALSVIGGHMGRYCGDLVIVDATNAKNNTDSKSCIQLIAPKRASTPEDLAKLDMTREDTKLFQNPYPLDESGFLVSYRKSSSQKFGVYWMNPDGDRELIAWDSLRSISQPVSLRPRITKNPYYTRPDYRKKTASMSVFDVREGAGIKGYTGTVEKIRVVGLEYRTDPAFGHTGAMSYQMTPVGRFGCTWDAKWIIGEKAVATDGSAAFDVPADVPLYLQLIDSSGVCVQTMRSWVSLRPGEQYECYGCHEENVAVPTLANRIQKLDDTPKPLDAFYEVSGKRGAFHYPEVIQPLLDKHCVKSGCHDASHEKCILTSTKLWTNELEDSDNKRAFRFWNTSYYNLTSVKHVKVECLYGTALPIPPMSTGSAKSPLVKRLQDGHVENLPDEVIDKVAAWIDLGIPHSGTYTDDMRPEDSALYAERCDRRTLEEALEQKNIEAYLQWNPQPCDCPEAIRSHASETKPLTKMFLLHYDRIAGGLFVKVPSGGRLTLLDLSGRQVYTKEILHDKTARPDQLVIPVVLSPGIYIVKYTGVTFTRQQMLTVM